jgi:membrane peptidoglycan carboxypeptidase
VRKFLDRLAASRYWTGDGLPHWHGHAAVRVGALVLAGVWACTSMVMGAEVYRANYDRRHLPDLGAFIRFEFPSVGRVNDRNGDLLMGLAREKREITHYEDIPPVVRGAILATEDKRFYEHGGIDVFSVPRAMWKARVTHGHVRFPQGGSTITQQLVRGAFLQGMTAKENTNELQYPGVVPHVMSWFVGARNVNRILRKREEVRLSLWLEGEMRKQFGSRERAKEEILARYASLIYMGNGQYGFARASEYYFGKPLASFTEADADKAALLASIAKAPRNYAPDASDSARVLQRRNQTLALMAESGVIPESELASIQARPLPRVVERDLPGVPSSAVVSHVLDELKQRFPEYGLEDLLKGSVQVNSTVDARVQQFANEALQHGLELYEKRYTKATGLIQGAVVVLSNSDGAILAEVGGRQSYKGQSSTYKDYNRVTDARRQPGSAMKPIVYLAAFRNGDFTLDTPVPDEPISVPNSTGDAKWISNYDGQFKGIIPLREALAESRNAVAIWVTEQIGLDSVLRTARTLGVKTPLQPYPTTALGASEVNLLELASAYRTIASGVTTDPYLIRSVVSRDGEVVPAKANPRLPAAEDRSLALIQEGLRGVVRLPTGTAHALDSRALGVQVMGKTGTTNDYKDALFVGSTYGEGGITIAVRIGFDDNHSLGRAETGGRVALPVFRELVQKIYGGKIFGKPPAFPSQIEQHINDYLLSAAAVPVAAVQSGTGEIR